MVVYRLTKEQRDRTVQFLTLVGTARMRPKDPELLAISRKIAAGKPTGDVYRVNLTKEESVILMTLVSYEEFGIFGQLKRQLLAMHKTPWEPH